jgi:hypothetical protein
MADTPSIDWLLEELGSTMELAGQQVRPAALMLLTADLMHVDPGVLRVALARIRAEHKGPILTGTVMQYVDHAIGRLLPAEAYALALSSIDQAVTVVWNNEIATAWAVAAPLVTMGDKFGARLAFMEAYGRVTGEARALRKRPEVQISLGHDTEGRARALVEAAARLPGGLDALPEEARNQLALPSPRAQLALPAPESMPKGPQRETLEKLSKLRDSLAQRAGRFSRTQVLARADRMRTQRLKRESSNAVAIYMSGLQQKASEA